ncbi:MAG TPA: glutamate--tRNA ligase family protein [Candidatus Paceibacterota bacterium]|nr:glutamate--tRNA ligase family protein [Verrucomicrobiota bacterium]HSA11224.1 glutamate--tRNA ligase family protein [Candidatus Paceibacterota bacterium]
MSDQPYRGRLAPSPTGLLHLGHARTFWVAQERTRASGGTLVLRNEDLDSTRYRMEFVEAMIEDLKWFGFDWQEGPDCGGPFGPYSQSERRKFYVGALERLHAAGVIYPCTCSRKDILTAARAPHAEDDREPIYPGTCRAKGAGLELTGVTSPVQFRPPGPRVNWRFRVPQGETVTFVDGNYGAQHFVAGKDFGDFVVWRQVDEPSYQLACTVDDAAMQITEVVRGADLLPSTARQMLLYRALALTPPQFYHCPLMADEAGVRLAKRHDALSLRRLREEGKNPASLRTGW